MENIELWAVCHTCKHKHSLHREAQGAWGYWQDWVAKHPHCEIEMLPTERKQRDWEGYRHNADLKEAYASSAAYTITLASLATSATLIAGRQSTTIDNTTNKYLEYMVGGRITNGTTPTVNTTIEVFAFGSVNDTPTYTDQFTGSDADRSVTSVNVKQSAVRLVDRLIIDAVTDSVNWFGPVALSEVFGRRIPKFHGLWVTHSTAVDLNATGGNHVLNYTGHFNTVT